MDVFIVGAGPSLNSFDLGKLKGQTSIGLNRTWMKFDPTYILSEHPEEIEAALTSGYSGQCVYAKPYYFEGVNHVGVLTYRREFPEHLSELPPHAPILSKDNGAFAATHFAVMLGAKRIIYIAVEMRNRAHFYDTDEHNELLPFHSTYDHTDSFKEYFDVLGRQGVEPLTVNEDSVVRDAGAEIILL